jgi:hypothetical protein
MPATRGLRRRQGDRLREARSPTSFGYAEPSGLFRGSFDYLATPRDICELKYILFEPVFHFLKYLFILFLFVVSSTTYL